MCGRMVLTSTGAELEALFAFSVDDPKAVDILAGLLIFRRLVVLTAILLAFLLIL